MPMCMCQTASMPKLSRTRSSHAALSALEVILHLAERGDQVGQTTSHVHCILPAPRSPLPAPRSPHFLPCLILLEALHPGGQAWVAAPRRRLRDPCRARHVATTQSLCQRDQVHVCVCMCMRRTCMNIGSCIHIHVHIGASLHGMCAARMHAYTYNMCMYTHVPHVPHTYKSGVYHMLPQRGPSKSG